jgi:hypothetical protein
MTETPTHTVQYTTVLYSLHDAIDTDEDELDSNL